MRVVLFSTRFFEYTIELANALSSNVKVSLFLPKNLMSEEEIEQISSSLDFQPYNLRRRINILGSIFMIISIARRIRSINPDVIHIQGEGHNYFFIAFLLLRKYPFVDTVHDVIPHVGDERADKLFMRSFSSFFSSGWIAHGDHQKLQLSKFYDVPKEKITVMPIGQYSFFKRISKRKFNEDKNKILFFGRIAKYKGLKHLIKAGSLIKKEHPEAKIVIAGTGDSMAPYSDLINNNDVFIIKNYRIPNNEVDELFQKCSFVILPYIDASQSGVISTAYSYGKPVIVTNVGSLSQYVIENQTGFVIPSRDSSAIADSALKLLKDPNLKDRMSKSVLKLSNSIMSWPVIAQKTITSYKNTIRHFRNEK